MRLLPKLWLCLSLADIGRYCIPWVKPLVDMLLLANDVAWQYSRESCSTDKEGVKVCRARVPAAVTLPWETLDELRSKRVAFDSFYDIFKNNVVCEKTGEWAVPTAYIYTGDLSFTHKWLIRENMHSFTYSNEESRKYSIERYVRNSLYFATPEYKDHLFKQYSAELDESIRYRADREKYVPWAVTRTFLSLQRSAWFKYQQVLDTMFATYTYVTGCRAVPITCEIPACPLPPNEYFNPNN